MGKYLQEYYSTIHKLLGGIRSGKGGAGMRKRGEDMDGKRQRGIGDKKTRKRRCRKTPWEKSCRPPLVTSYPGSGVASCRRGYLNLSYGCVDSGSPYNCREKLSPPNHRKGCANLCYNQPPSSQGTMSQEEFCKIFPLCLFAFSIPLFFSSSSLKTSCMVPKTS